MFRRVMLRCSPIASQFMKKCEAGAYLRIHRENFRNSLQQQGNTLNTFPS